MLFGYTCSPLENLNDGRRLSYFNCLKNGIPVNSHLRPVRFFPNALKYGCKLKCLVVGAFASLQYKPDLVLWEFFNLYRLFLKLVKREILNLGEEFVKYLKVLYTWKTFFLAVLYLLKGVRFKTVVLVNNTTLVLGVQILVLLPLNFFLDIKCLKWDKLLYPSSKVIKLGVSLVTNLGTRRVNSALSKIIYIQILKSGVRFNFLLLKNTSLFWLDTV